METLLALLILAAIIGLFAAVPALIAYSAAKATEFENAELHSSATASSKDTAVPPPITPAVSTEMQAPPPAPPKQQAKQSRRSPQSPFAVPLVVLLCLPPAVGLATLVIGGAAFMFAVVMSIVAFGYGGFFDFSSKAIRLGVDILFSSFWFDLAVIGLFFLYRLIKLLRSM